MTIDNKDNPLSPEFYKNFGILTEKVEQSLKLQEEYKKEASDRFDRIEKKLNEQGTYISKWRGAAFVFMGVGGALVWILDKIHILDFFK